jgi:predicted nucleic acid-binding protein
MQRLLSGWLSGEFNGVIGGRLTGRTLRRLRCGSVSITTCWFWMSFVDSNVVLYTASKDPADTAKSAMAARLMTETRFGISLQVVQEFYHNARIKARLGITKEQSERVVGLLLQRPLVITDVELFNEARRLAERFQLRYWDAAIVAASKRLGASTLFSEDLNDGQEYDGITVVNPFKGLD